VVYFSGNGLYYPSTLEAFNRAIVENNRFEWLKNKASGVGKHIFVRDIFKQWYLEGINSRLNSIDKVADFLRAETQGWRVTTVGSSAGGFAAVLFGLLIGAEEILSFSGQYAILTVLEQFGGMEKNPLVVKYMHHPQVKKFYDLCPFISQSDIPIFYFLPANSRQDQRQREYIRSFDNVQIFPLKDGNHGIPFYRFNLGDILKMSSAELKHVLAPMRNKTTSKFAFSLRVSGMRKTLVGLQKQTLKSLKRNLRKYTRG